MNTAYYNDYHYSNREVKIDLNTIIPYETLPKIHLSKIDGGIDYLYIDLTKDINSTEQDILNRICKKFTKSTKDIIKAKKNKEIGKIKNKTNNNKRPELSLQFSYDLNSPKVLSTHYTIDNNNSIMCWLYSIQLTNTPSHECNFGMCLSTNIPFEVSFQLIHHLNHEMDTCTIKPIGYIKASQEMFDAILFFHIKLYYDIFLLKEFNHNDFNGYKNRLFAPNTIEKKYLFIPLTLSNMNGNETYQIDWQIISNSQLLYYKAQGITLEQQLINKENVSQLKKNNLYATSYRTWNIYELKDILYSNDTFDTLMDKLSSNISDYRETIRDKYFKGIDRTYNAWEIINYSDCTAASIVGFRALGEKYKIHINPKPIGYAYGMKMHFIPDSYLYNKNIINNQCKAIYISNDNDNEKKNNNKNLKKIIYPIFPIDHLIKFYLSKKQIEHILKFPSIFSTYETMLIPYQMAIDFDLSKDLTSTRSFNYFLWAGTTPQLMKDYDYESLEILGDSILKVVLTIQLYVNDDKNPHLTAGQLEHNRSDVIRNNYLYQIGIKTHINQYIMSKEYYIKDWDYPLRSFRQIYHQTITEKILADVMEAYIGSCYLKSFNIGDCIHFINKCQICPDNIRDNVQEYINEKVIKNCLDWRPLYLVYLSKDLSLLGLLSMFNTAYIEINRIEELDKIIKYSFKNKELLLKAFRHYTYNRDNGFDNYEKLELLGDSIVEAYITTSLFYWYAPFMYNNITLNNTNTKNNKSKYYKKNNNGIDSNDGDESESDSTCYSEEIVSILKAKAKKFNNENMTHIKSYFCSNSFMCQLASFLQLYKFIQYSPGRNISETIKDFSSEVNLNLLIHRKLNEYESSKAFMPKIIADVFEALIGAIFCDSDLMTTFKVLDRLYGPFVIYAGIYFDELKYSCVDDFTRKFSMIYRMTAEYRILNNGDDDNDCEVGIFHSGNICYCTGKGKGIDNAKQNAAMNGLNRLKQEEQGQITKKQ